MFSSCSNEIIIIIPRKISPGFVLCDALKFLIYKKTDGGYPNFLGGSNLGGNLGDNNEK